MPMRCLAGEKLDILSRLRNTAALTRTSPSSIAQGRKTAAVSKNILLDHSLTKFLFSKR